VSLNHVHFLIGYGCSLVVELFHSLLGCSYDLLFERFARYFCTVTVMVCWLSMVALDYCMVAGRGGRLSMVALGICMVAYKVYSIVAMVY